MAKVVGRKVHQVTVIGMINELIELADNNIGYGRNAVRFTEMLDDIIGLIGWLSESNKNIINNSIVTSTLNKSVNIKDTVSDVEKIISWFKKQKPKWLYENIDHEQPITDAITIELIKLHHLAKSINSPITKKK